MNNEFTKITQDNITRYILESDSGTTTAGSVATVPGALGKVRKRGDNILAQEADKKTVPASTPRNFVAKNAKTGGAGAHKDKKKAEKQGDVKHRKPFAEQGVAEGSKDPQSELKLINQKLKDAYKHIRNNSSVSIGWYMSEVKALNARREELIKQLKQGVAEGFNGEYDDEAGMAQSNLLTTARAVMGLLKTIKDRDNLPEWGQEKIAKAEMMLVSVWDYLQSQKAMGNDPQQDMAEGERTMSRAAKGNEKYGKDGMKALAKEGVDPYFESLRARVEELAKK